MKVTTDACLFGGWMTDLIKKENFHLQNALDIGTGTGLLSLMIAQETDFNIDAIEIDEAAAEQAIQNIAQSIFNEKINVFATSLQDYKSQKKYDLIFSNPPFYEGDLKSPNEEKNKAMHDTGLALVEIMRYADENLADRGHLMLLLPEKRTTDIKKFEEYFDFHIHHHIQVKQSMHHTIFRHMLHIQKIAPSELFQQSIAIKREDGLYTDDFIHLLKPYYQLL